MTHPFRDPLDAMGALVVHLPALAGDEDLVAAPARLDHPPRLALAHVPLDHVQVPVARVRVGLVAEQARLPILAPLHFLVAQGEGVVGLGRPTAATLRGCLRFVERCRCDF